MWLLFAVLLFPAGFAGWAVGHYTSLGKPPSTVVKTVTATVTSASGSTTVSATTTAATTTSSSTSGNAAAGKSVFVSNGCGSCHTFKPAGATGSIGPNLDTAPTADAKKDKNMDLAAFVKESIVSPDAYVPQGYPKGVMPSTFGKTLSSSQLNDLVAFIVSGAS